MMRSCHASKYHNKKCRFGNLVFDSVLERARYFWLSDLAKKGRITDLRRQVEIVIIPGYRYDVTTTVNLKTKTKEVTKSYVQEEPAIYKADFTYRLDGRLCVEDTKGGVSRGTRTPDYVMKRKLMLSLYGIQVHEVHFPTQELAPLPHKCYIYKDITQLQS